MGTKRVGWARIRSLINENGNQIAAPRVRLKTALTADTTLVNADCGDIILLDGSAELNVEHLMPTAPLLGMEMKFLLTVTSHANTEILLDSGSGCKFEGYAIQLLALSNATAYHSDRKLGFGDASRLGAYLHVVCVDATAGALRWAIVDSKSSIAFVNAFS